MGVPPKLSVQYRAYGAVRHFKQSYVHRLTGIDANHRVHDTNLSMQPPRGYFPHIFLITASFLLPFSLGEPIRQRTSIELPMTSAYVFMDYRSQGQTIARVIVDIRCPPTGSLTPFNAYVALLRSSGHQTIWLLRNFDDKLFTKVPCYKLEAEDKRLENLDRLTKL
jgi:hypothetical protein